MYLNRAENEIIRKLQCKYCSREISCIHNNFNLPKTSSLEKLHPIIDEAGILRVGGRLSHAITSYDVKYPVVRHAATSLYCWYVTATLLLDIWSEK